MRLSTPPSTVTCDHAECGELLCWQRGGAPALKMWRLSQGGEVSLACHVSRVSCDVSRVTPDAGQVRHLLPAVPHRAALPGGGILHHGSVYLPGHT